MSLSSLRTLVVDDHALMSQILCVMLRAFGVHNMSLVQNVAEAQSIYRAKPFDLVITDLEMPGASGLDLVRWIRTSHESLWHQVPIIMVTAHTDRVRIERARDAGVTELVSKPISAQMLMMRIVSAIDRPRAFIRCASYVGPDRRRRNDNKYAGSDRRKAGVDVEID